MNVGVLGLSGCIIYAMDLNHLVHGSQSAQMIAERVSVNWIRDVQVNLSQWDQFGFAQPRFAESAYGKTDRAARNTIAARYSGQLLPLEIPIVDPPHALHGKFAYYVESIRISPQGALSIRVVVSAEGNVLTARDVVHNYHSLISSIPASLESSTAQFVEFWNACIDGIPLEIPNRRDLMAALQSYDIWDYDFILLDGANEHDVGSVKELYTRDDPIPTQELTAIANMDIADVESLRDVHSTQFTDSDIGTRDDEFWVIGRERMTRRHPERAVVYNIAFFADVKLATEILLGYKCALNFMEEWVRKQRRSLLDEILRYKDLTELRKQDLQQRYADVVRASQVLVEPISLERGVKHGFFVQVINRLIDVFELNANTTMSARTMSEFTRLVESVAAFHDAELSERLDSIQVEVARSSRRIARIGVGLAVVGILLAAAQLYIGMS